MKQRIKFFIFLALIGCYQFSQTSCTGCNRPEPNFEGVLMENCGKNGLADFKVVTGAQGPLGPCSELYQVPMFEQKADPEALGVSTNDGGYFTVNPQYTYSATRGKGPEICFNYRQNGPQDKEFLDKIEENTLNPLVLNAYREEARNFTTDSLLKSMAKFELAVETRLTKEFSVKFFGLINITSGLKPPESMIKAIENKNNVAQEIDKERQELEKSRIRLEKAKIDRDADLVKSQGLTKEILQDKYIDALRNTQNKVIITDGRTPVIINQ